MPNLLLVEGRDDAYVFNNLLNSYDIGNQVVYGKPSTSAVVSIQSEDGIDKLLINLPQRLRATNTPQLGIVVDADTNISNRWNELRRILLSEGYSTQNVPVSPDPNGTIIEQQGMDVFRVGIWVMLNNILTGTLEHFIEFLIPSTDNLWSHAKSTVDTLPEHRFTSIQTMKANLHTWLAWQQEPGPPMGLAITMKYLDSTETHAQLLIQWVRSLFAIAPNAE